jgi:hypothetical protein
MCLTEQKLSETSAFKSDDNPTDSKEDEATFDQKLCKDAHIRQVLNLMTEEKQKLEV